MKKLHTILECICTAAILPLLVAVMVGGCKKDSKETGTLVYVFEWSGYKEALENYDKSDSVVFENGYIAPIDSVKIDSAYHAYELNDFSYDGKMKNGKVIYISKGNCFATYLNDVYSFQFDSEIICQIQYGITDSLFSVNNYTIDGNIQYDNIQYFNIEHHTDYSFSISGKEYMLTDIRDEY